MKRYVCTVAAGLLLALAGTGTASAGLPLSGQTGTQVIGFGDQSVGEQRNEADVTQAQGNGNINIAPAIALFGDAETTNAQGNGNTAVAVIDQSNSVDQSQSAAQQQSLDRSGAGCCGAAGQSAEQAVYGGDQSVGEQRNDADVSQYQGNGNINVAPAIAVFGDAETTNDQGNGNTAVAVVDQSNSVEQSQASAQKQSLEQDGSNCCGGRSQTGEQKIHGGDQWVGKQKNDADVSQYQGNGNINVAPAIAVFGDAETTNDQGNGNTAVAVVEQSNSVDQSQRALQWQWLAKETSDCCTSSSGCNGWDNCKPKKESCCESGPSQTGEQTTSSGDQSVGEQRNDADVTQKQGNGNLSLAPALAFGRTKHDSCYSKCGEGWYPSGGNAETVNKQGNGNEAVAWVGQSNSADQSQASYQHQDVVDMCKGLVYR